MINRKEAKESIDSYLGEKEKSVLRTVDRETLELFKSKNVLPNKSYYVRGSKRILEQFKSYYLVNCLKEEIRPKYGLHMITEWASLLSSTSMDDYGADDVLFLYAHKNDIDIGKSEEWLAKTIINDVANRNRKGYATVILTERDLPLVKACGELTPITLSKTIRGSTPVEESKSCEKTASGSTVYN